MSQKERAESEEDFMESMKGYDSECIKIITQEIQSDNMWREQSLTKKKIEPNIFNTLHQKNMIQKFDISMNPSQSKRQKPKVQRASHHSVYQQNQAMSHHGAMMTGGYNPMMAMMNNYNPMMMSSNNPMMMMNNYNPMMAMMNNYNPMMATNNYNPMMAMMNNYNPMMAMMNNYNPMSTNNQRSSMTNDQTPTLNDTRPTMNDHNQSNQDTSTKTSRHTKRETRTKAKREKGTTQRENNKDQFTIIDQTPSKLQQRLHTTTKPLTTSPMRTPVGEIEKHQMGTLSFPIIVSHTPSDFIIQKGAKKRSDRQSTDELFEQTMAIIAKENIKFSLTKTDERTLSQINLKANSLDSIIKCIDECHISDGYRDFIRFLFKDVEEDGFSARSELLPRINEWLFSRDDECLKEERETLADLLTALVSQKQLYLNSLQTLNTVFNSKKKKKNRLDLLSESNRSSITRIADQLRQIVTDEKKKASLLYRLVDKKFSGQWSEKTIAQFCIQLNTP